MADWKTSSETMIVPSGASYFPPMMLDVDVGTGRVEVQRLQADGATWTPIVGGILEESGEYQIARANGSSLRIVAIGDAKYFARGQ